MFMLVSARYERASLIVTSNKAFSAWGEIFGDEVTATAMIDRLVHHAEILALKGDQLPASRQGSRPAAAGRDRLIDHPRRFLPRRQAAAQRLGDGGIDVGRLDSPSGGQISAPPGPRRPADRRSASRRPACLASPTARLRRRV